MKNFIYILNLLIFLTFASQINCMEDATKQEKAKKPKAQKSSTEKSEKQSTSTQKKQLIDTDAPEKQKQISEPTISPADVDIVEVVPKAPEKSEPLPTPKKSFFSFDFFFGSKTKKTEPEATKSKPAQKPTTAQPATTKTEKKVEEITQQKKPLTKELVEKQLKKEKQITDRLAAQEEKLRAKTPINYLKLQQNLAQQDQSNKRKEAIMTERLKFLNSLESEYGKNIILGNRRTMTDDIKKNSQKVIDALKESNYENLSKILQTRIKFLDSAIADAQSKIAKGLTGVTTDSLGIYERERRLFQETLDKCALMTEATKAGDTQTVQSTKTELENTFNQKIDEIEKMNKDIAEGLAHPNITIQKTQALEAATLKTTKNKLDATQNTLHEQQKRVDLMLKPTEDIKEQISTLSKELEQKKQELKAQQTTDEYKAAKASAEKLQRQVTELQSTVSDLSSKKAQSKEAADLYNEKNVQLEELKAQLSKAKAVISQSEENKAIQALEAEIKLHQSVLEEKTQPSE